MQNVLNGIELKVTTSAKTLVVLGAKPNGSASEPAIFSAFNRSNLPLDGWNIVFVNDASNIDMYLGGGAAQATDEKGNALASTISLAQTGIMEIATANTLLGDDLTDAELGVLDQHGVDIRNYLSGGGGLFA